MKIAILGGGLTGLTAAYYLVKKGHQITIFEKEKQLGGLASGFKTNHWQWYLERSYHHLFTNDNQILDFAKEIGFNKIFFKTPITASLYINKKTKQFDDLVIFPLDTPQDFLRFSLLSFPKKIRAGLVLAFLKFSPFFSFYEKQTAAEFLKKTMGKDSWNILWQQLFRKKFGEYAEKILASFIWARIKKRTKKLGYIKGGFQNFINYLEERLRNLKVELFKEIEIKEIKRQKERFVINDILYEVVISTLPTPILTKISQKIFPKNYLSQLTKIRYLHALTLILETEKPIIDKVYWLNISVPEIPIMVIAQQTNFIDKKYYGSKHIAYLGWYLKLEDRIWKMKDKELLNYLFPYLKRINPYFSSSQIINYYLFRAPFAQPIFDKEFIKNKPDFQTPLKNFYIANLDMTYPYDRGTNYAVDLGRKIAYII